ncbi:MAG TPA: hemerythrin domain-containing protein [Thermoanaerobaculia bacterium]|nr:hemerythrin domain-containing protein [Thermoanaerobaculia bacterium]
MDPESAEPIDLTREHRRLDDLFGKFLGAAQAGDIGSAREAIRVFDEALRLHTAAEERSILAPPEGHKLAPPETETDEQRLHRELLLEHVQVRELSAMIRHLLDEKNDLEGARRLAPNLARRWDAHTAREERELFGGKNDA